MLKTLVNPAISHGSAAALSNVGGLHTASTLDLSQYLLSQSTIVCSVAPELISPRGESPYNLIDESCTHLVNQNGDAWLNQVILETYRTFQGAFNFVEHNQVLSENKGRILDAVARKILLMKPDAQHVTEQEEIGFSSGVAPSASEFLMSLQPSMPTPKPKVPQKLHTNQAQFVLDKSGQPKYVYYIDILVATSLKFTRLIEQILDGEFNAMSMGCVVTGSTCSYCGHQIREPYPSFCPCLLNDRGTLKKHPHTDRLVAVAELCGIPGEPETNQFIEASWVADPAFIGARKAYIIDLPEGYSRKTYSIPAVPELKNIPKAAANLKAASAEPHKALIMDYQTLRNTAIAFSHNPTLRNQLNRYLQLYGFEIGPLPGRTPHVIQKNDMEEFQRVQKQFKALGLR